MFGQNNKKINKIKTQERFKDNEYLNIVSKTFEDIRQYKQKPIIKHWFVGNQHFNKIAISKKINVLNQNFQCVWLLKSNQHNCFSLGRQLVITKTITLQIAIKAAVQHQNKTHTEHHSRHATILHNTDQRSFLVCLALKENIIRKE